VFLIWRYVSLASICAAIALGVSVWFVFPHALEAGIFRSIFCAGAGIFVILLHHGNIRRLISGTEHKIGHKKPKTEET
ncbi:MAG: glycerol-3-phosphate acyltransferase, partial [Planctomycetes bacterium]|nr:glycerol-3-phosphate acyltransferase [Planctomycetota bacterium]